MWIDRVEVGGFRGLSGLFDFTPSLNIVVGDNEAGKSSLHDALVRLLYGFSRSERRRARGSSVLERCAPWDGTPFRLAGIVRDDSAEYRIEWDFARHRVRVMDGMARDISDRVAGRGDDVRLGRTLLGLDYEDFRQVCCIDQEALLSVRQSPTLGMALQEAVANVSGDTPVQHAVEALNEFLRSTIGARVDNLRPSPTGTLSALLRERDALREQLQELENARERLRQISYDRAKARDEHEVLLRARDRARQLRLADDARALDQRVQEAERLLGIASSAPPPEDELPDALVDAVKIARDHVSTAERDLASATREAETVAAEVRRLEDEQRELLAQVDGLAPYAEVDVSAREAVQALSAQLDALDTDVDAPAPAIPPRDPLLERYRHEREDLYAAVAGRRRVTLRRVLWITLIVMTLGLAWVIRRVVRRIRRPQARSADPLVAYGGASLHELDERVTEEDRRVAQAEALVAAYAERRAAHEERRRELTQRLQGALDEVAAPAAELDARVRAYLTAVERHLRYLGRHAALNEVRRRVVELRRAQEDASRAQRDLDAARRGLADAYGAAGIAEADLVLAGVDFDKRLAAAHGAAAERQEAAKAAAALDALLAGATPDDLRQQRDHVAATLAEHGTARADLRTGDALNLDSEELEDALATTAERVTELETLERQLEEQVGDPASLKERLALVEERLKRLDEAKEGVAIARTLLQESADELSREFAPHLNEALRRNLARVTGGRYSEALVDAELRVSVVVPATGRVHSADELSRATKDQIFLVERLEIARLLAPTKPLAPLLLDDPFAHYDRHRIAYALEVLAEVAGDRQVFVFTEDEELEDIARAHCASCNVLALPSPAVAAVVV